MTMDGAALSQLVPQLRDQLSDLKSKRNYIQNDRDMVENFYNNTRKEIDELEKRITNKETKAERLEIEHRAEIKVFMQKVKHLEYDQKAANDIIKGRDSKDRTQEDTYHKDWLNDMKKGKKELKEQLGSNEAENQQKVTEQNRNHQQLLDMTQTKFQESLRKLIQDYEKKLAKLREDLELKLKVEIHEIEERKNLHINELMRNHDEAFAELKSYYNEITAENLNLIKAQKHEIEGIQATLGQHKKLIEATKSDNNSNKEPLEEAIRQRNILKNQLKQHEKDKMSLANLKTKLIVLKEKIAKLAKESDDLFARYAKVVLYAMHCSLFFVIG